MNNEVGPVPINRRTRAWFVYLSFLVLLLTPPFAIGYIIESIFGGRRKGFLRWTRSWGKTIFWLAGIKLRVEGVVDESDTPCVFVANHQNSLDIPAMAVAIGVPFGYVAKASLARMPFLGWALRISPSVFVDTRNPKVSIESMGKAAREIRSGSSVVIFPEGERTWSDQMVPFKKRGLALAVEAGVPIVPVAIVDAHTLFDERHHAARPGPMGVVVGAPISPDEIRSASMPELLDSVQNRIREMSRQYLRNNEN